MSTLRSPVVVTNNLAPTATEVTPIIVDLGKEKKKRIKDLKRGRGRLMLDIEGVVNDVRLNLGEDADNKVFVPVVIIYRKKSKRRRADGGLLFPFLG